MKTLKNSKVLAWMLAVITACCAFLGVILTTPQNVALADDSATQITNDTFPDTSNLEEKQLEWQEDGHILVEEGKIYRFNGDLNGISYSLIIAYETVSPDNGSPSSVGGVSITFGSDGKVNYDTSMLPTGLSYVTKEVTEGKLYVDFVCYLDSTNSYDYIDMYIMGSDGILTDAETYGYMITELVEPEAQPGVDETPDVEKDKPLSDKVADFINENTGLAVTGSLVTIVAIGAGVYFVFFRKRR